MGLIWDQYILKSLHVWFILLSKDPGYIRDAPLALAAAMEAVFDPLSLPDTLSRATNNTASTAVALGESAERHTRILMSDVSETLKAAQVLSLIPET
jgi:hypothetical protein